jgi:hypothetical protein
MGGQLGAQRLMTTVLMLVEAWSRDEIMCVLDRNRDSLAPPGTVVCFYTLCMRMQSKPRMGHLASA